jgi:hypothetical protein
MFRDPIAEDPVILTSLRKESHLQIAEERLTRYRNGSSRARSAFEVLNTLTYSSK